MAVCSSIQLHYETYSKPVSNFVDRQADEQIQFPYCVFILPTFCEKRAIKWGGST
jgi:hypothetical protein